MRKPFYFCYLFFQISIPLLSQRKVQLKPVFWNVILNPSSSTLFCSPINKQKRHKFLHTFCFIEYGSFFLYQKTIIKSTFCFVAYSHVFDNESKCVVFVFISIPTIKMPLKVTFKERSRSIKFWILYGPKLFHL